MKKSILYVVIAFLSLTFLSCTKPEIAVVLEDYCNYQKGCGYVNVNTQTQYHDYGSCSSFHKDLLNNTAKNKASGCKADVEQFFIDFMNAQMERGCNATLAQTLNEDETTQNQLTTMLKCIQNNGTNVSTTELGEMGMNVLNTLEIDMGDLSPDVIVLIFGAVLGG